MARLLGKDEFLSCLSLTTLDDLHTLDSVQLAKVQQCTLDNVNRITRSLVHEAAARDDVTTGAQAAAYLQERLAQFGDLLSEEARQRIREGYLALTAEWGSSAS
jgi:hypothetical protein